MFLGCRGPCCARGVGAKSSMGPSVGEWPPHPPRETRACALSDTQPAPRCVHACVRASHTHTSLRSSFLVAAFLGCNSHSAIRPSKVRWVPHVPRWAALTTAHLDRFHRRRRDAVACGAHARTHPAPAPPWPLSVSTASLPDVPMGAAMQHAVFTSALSLSKVFPRLVQAAARACCGESVVFS